MAEPKPKLRVELVYGRDGKSNAPRIRIPAPVRDFLGAKLGDKLIFEEGCAHSAMVAALAGPYLIVRLERAEPAPAEVISIDTNPTEIEPFAAAVARRKSS